MQGSSPNPRILNYLYWITLNHKCFYTINQFSNSMSKLITIIILFITTISISSVMQSIEFEFSYAQEEQEQIQPNQTTNSNYSQNIDDNVFTTLREGNAVLSLSSN